MEKVKFETTADLGVITMIDAPLNLLGSQMRDDLAEAIAMAGQRKLRGLVLKADEGNFSAGADVNLFLEMTPEAARERFTGFHKLLHTIESFPFPTMALVRGMCLAGGLEVALAFDLIWAAENALFGQVEVNIGALPFGGGGQRLAARAGSARAKEIVFSGRIYQAKDFEKWNIITRTLPEAELNAKAMAYMQHLANNGATVALGSAKRLINTYFDKGLAEADLLTIDLSADIFATEDLKVGVRSLLKDGPGKARFAGK